MRSMAHPAAGRHTEPMGSRLRCPALVGRVPELDLVERLAVDVESGQGNLVVMAGDAGVGKSRLVEELVSRRREAGWTTAVGGCVALGGDGLTHAALREIVRELAGELGAGELERATGEGFDELHALLPGHPAAGGGDAVRLFEQVLTLFVRLAQDRPLLVVFEDAHWADGSTRDLLLFLARNIRSSRLLVVVTYRSDDVPRRRSPAARAERARPASGGRDRAGRPRPRRGGRAGCRPARSAPAR